MYASRIHIGRGYAEKFITDLQDNYVVGVLCRGGQLAQVDPVLSSEDFTVDDGMDGTINFNYGFTTESERSFHS